MNNEIWLPVVGYENLYEVSNLGRVRSLVSGRVLRVKETRAGYLLVGLCKYNMQKWYLVHRLVATAFLDNPLNLPQVNHKNEVKTDNQVENLEWCDARYNSTYGSLADRVREVYQYDLDGEFVAWFPSTAEAERRTGVDSGGIGMCARGESKTYKGFQWRYEPALFLDVTEGKFNNAQSKHVYQYTLDGRFVKEWPSVNEVARQTGWSDSNISACCRGKHHQRYGYRWFYEYRGSNLNATKPSHELSKLF